MRLAYAVEGKKILAIQLFRCFRIDHPNSQEKVLSVLFNL